MSSLSADEVKRRVDIVSLIGETVKLKLCGKGYTGLCPFHEDTDPSLSVSGEGKFWKCHACAIGGDIFKWVQQVNACDFKSALAFLVEKYNLEKPNGEVGADRKPEAIYDYQDVEGNLLYQVLRFPGKKFKQRRPDPLKDGGYVWKLDGVQRVPFRLPELLSAVAQGKTIYIPEGEKDVLALVKYGVAATCNSGGAGKWVDAYNESFRGAHVVVWQDKDEPGRKHARRIVTALRNIAASIRLVEAREGKDAYDHLNAGLSIDEATELSIDLVEEESTPLPQSEEDEVQERPFSLLTLADLENLPDKQWIFKGLLAKGDLAMVFGRPGGGKTFFVIALAFAAIRGHLAFANEFGIHDPVRVVFATGEKQNGLKLRFRAAAKKWPLRDEQKARLRICTKVPQLFDLESNESVEAFIRDLRGDYPDGFEILAVDTFHNATVGVDENSALDAGKVLRSLRRITESFGCAIILLHHPNRAGTGERGSSAYRGSFDAVVEISNGPGGFRKMTCEKIGDDKDGLAVLFKLEPVEGVESVVVEWEGRTSALTLGAREEVVRILRANEGQKLEAKDVKELVTLDNVTKDAVLKVLNRLHDEGQERSGVVRTLRNPDKQKSNTNPWVFAYRSERIAGYVGAPEDDPFA